MLLELSENLLGLSFIISALFYGGHPLVQMAVQQTCRCYPALVYGVREVSVGEAKQGHDEPRCMRATTIVSLRL